MLTFKDDLEEVAEKISVNSGELRSRSILLLPENVFSAESVDEMIDADDSVYLTKYLRSNGVDCATLFDLGHHVGAYDRRGADVWLGILWLFLENDGFAKSIEVLLQWLKTRYTSQRKSADSQNDDEPTIHVHLVMEENKKRSKLKFDGPAAHFGEVLAGLQKMHQKKKK